MIVIKCFTWYSQSFYDIVVWVLWSIIRRSSILLIWSHRCGAFFHRRLHWWLVVLIYTLLFIDWLDSCSDSIIFVIFAVKEIVIRIWKTVLFVEKSPVFFIQFSEGLSIQHIFIFCSVNISDLVQCLRYPGIQDPGLYFLISYRFIFFREAVH